MPESAGSQASKTSALKPKPGLSASNAKLDDMPKELRDAYLEVALHPEDLQSMFNKAVQRMRNFKDIPPEELRSITAPTLVVCGDSDVMGPEHAVEEFRLLPHAQLAILPLTDHMKVASRTSWLVPMVEEFLDGKYISAILNHLASFL